MDKSELRALKTEVSRILFEIWDPIGVSHLLEDQDFREDFANVRSEYSNYEDPILSLLINGASEDEIAAALNKFATEWMGIHDASEQAELRLTPWSLYALPRTSNRVQRHLNERR